MNSSKIIQDQIDIYKENFINNRDSPRGTYQNDRATQYLRFERIVKPFREILNESVSFHDFGCGVCDLHLYLNEQKIKHDYSGTEVVEEMIEHARQKYPGIRIIKRDILQESNPEKFDIVVFSGGLFLPGNIPKEDWKKFVLEIVAKMFESCRIAISFNLLTTYNTYEEPHLFYLDPKEMFDYCSSRLSRFVTLDQSYPLYEWTISVFKKEFMAKQYTQKELGKYLK